MQFVAAPLGVGGVGECCWVRAGGEGKGSEHLWDPPTSISHRSPDSTVKLLVLLIDKKTEAQGYDM